jgi:hypothetical protein
MFESTARPICNVLALFAAGWILAACNLGSYDDAVARFNEGRPVSPNPPPAPPAPPPAGFNPEFSAIQANVFTPDCATGGCHSGASPAAALNLQAAGSYAMLVGVASTQDAGTQRVNPGNPNLSYLIEKLEGPGATGERMPPGSPLPQAKIDVIRQWITDGATDDTAQPAQPVRVTSLSPAPGANLDTAPASVIAGFDRDVDASTVNATTFLLDASGGDGIFGNGNDVQIAAASITMATPQSAVFDLTGTVLADDTYQVMLKGAGASVIMDLDGNVLDGENTGALPSGDGAEGGDFIARFTVTTPVVLGPTLDQIQAVIFTPTCATSSCHAGGAPAGNLSLADADTSHANLVGVNSSGQAGAIRVVAMDPDNSYLIRKLEGAMGIAGQQMPPGQALSQGDIDVIRQWITDGALR